jgi:uncharacterized membrane protein YedE/YeeE
MATHIPSSASVPAAAEREPRVAGLTAQRATGAVLGVVFGFMLCWTGMVDPDVIRGALLFEEAYLFFFMGSAVATAAIGSRLLRRGERRAVMTGQRIAWKPEAVQRRHIVGSLLFGIGWGVSHACPGPVAAQIGQGIGWALITFAGILIGVRLFLAGAESDTEPAFDDAPEALRVTLPGPVPANVT